MKCSCSLLLCSVFAASLVVIPIGFAEEFVGDVTRFSPEEGQPLFPVGNINIFKQYAFGFEESVSVGKSVDIGFASFGAELDGNVGATLGFEFGLCIGGNADYDLGFKPRVSVPDKIPYEYPLTLHVSEGLMEDSQFTTNFPPLGKAYADLIFDVKAEAELEACVFGCTDFDLFKFNTGKLDDISYMNVNYGGLVPSQLKGIFATSLRCDPTVHEKAYTSIELASWNRKDDSTFRLLNVFADDVARFTAEPILEYTLGYQSGGGNTFTVDTEADKLETSGSSFKNGEAVALTSSGELPEGMASKKVYYVVNSSGKSMQLARRKGGSALDIKDEGEGTHSIESSDPKKPGSPKEGGPGSWGKISIQAATVSTSSSTSEVDSRERSFTVLPVSDELLIEPVFDLEKGLRGFSNGIKVRVKSGNTMPDGLNPACVYYIANADSSGLKVQLVTEIGGPVVDIQSLGNGTHKIFRSAEFNSVDGLSSTGAEDVAAITIDAIGLISDVVLQKSPLKMSESYDLGVADINYKIASLDVGPAIQLQTDFKMSWDLVVDDILFRDAYGVEPKQVQFPGLIDRDNPPVGGTLYTSLKGAKGLEGELGAFPDKTFHLTNVGEFALPEISLLNDLTLPEEEKAVTVMIFYHVEPKLKTKVSAPFLGRVKYEALQVGASIKKVGGISLGPLVDGEHEFKLGEFTFYDGDPEDLDAGQARTDFEESQDRDRYQLSLVDETSGESEPMEGCAEVYVLKRNDGFYLKVFDVEGEVMEKRSGKADTVLGNVMAAELASKLTPWPAPDAKEKQEILESASKVASLNPGVMSFQLVAAGPADYHWKPFATYDSNSEREFELAVNAYPNGIGDATPGLVNDYTYDTTIEQDAEGYDVYKGYIDETPQGVWRYGYIEPGTVALSNEWASGYDKDEFTLFADSNWSGSGEVFVEFDKDIVMEKLMVDPAGPTLLNDSGASADLKSRSEVWPVRRWISPGGRVEVDWGVALRPRPRTTSIGSGGFSGTIQNSNGVTGAVYVNGELKDTTTTAAVPTVTPSGVNFRLEIQSAPGAAFDANEPWFYLTNTGTVDITRFTLSIGDDTKNFDSVEFNDNNGGDVTLISPDSDNDGGLRSGVIDLRFNRLAPGNSVVFRADIDGQTLAIPFLPYDPVTNPYVGDNSAEDYRTVLFWNGVGPNAQATVYASGQQWSLFLNDPYDYQLPSYRFESESIDTDQITNWDAFTKSVILELEAGDVVDLVVSPKGTDGTHDAWQDEAVASMDIQVLAGDEWAAPNQKSPTNWIELLSGNAPHKPNAWPGSLFTGEFAASNWATIDTIDSAPFPRLTTRESIGSLNVKEGARLDFSPQDGNSASLTVFDGAVANHGTINVAEANGGAAALVVGSPLSMSTSLTGDGTLRMTDSNLIGGGSDATSGNFVFVNYNAIIGSGSAMDLNASHPNVDTTKIENMNSFWALGGAMDTGADLFINNGGLSASNSGSFSAYGGQIENRFGAEIGAFGGIDSNLQLTFDQGLNSGYIFATEGSTLRLLPGSSGNNVWSAGLNTVSDQLGTFISSASTMEFDSINLTGGTLLAKNGGEFVLQGNQGDVSITGSTVDIGEYDAIEVATDSGTLDLYASMNRFTGVGLRNFGTIIVNGGSYSDFIDMRSFENHGLIRVDDTATMRIREITDRTVDPLASNVARKFPGLANASSDSLLGGSWLIGGELLIDGAAITKIGSDSPAQTTYGVTDDAGNQLANSDSVNLEAQGLSLFQPAYVTITGNGSFPALDTLNLNSGTLRLLGEASLPRRGGPATTVGELANRGQLVVNNSSLSIGGRYIQADATTNLSVLNAGQVTSAENAFHIYGGSVDVAEGAQFMNLNNARDGFLPGTDIVVHSPYIRDGGYLEDAEITAASVSFGSDVQITTIDEGVSLTMHGRLADFPTSQISLNEGSFIVSGDHSLDNRGDVSVSAFTNAGQLSVLGIATEFRSGSFTQSDAAAVTHIGPGARMLNNGNLDVSDGEIIVEVEARPIHQNFYGRLQAGSQANFNGKLVIDFTGDFQDLRPDIGDTWEIMPRTSGTRISGVDTITYRVDGQPMQDGWLPAGTHLEAVQFTTVNGVRGLGIRLVPDAGFVNYDAFVAIETGGQEPSDYGAFSAQYFFGDRGSEVEQFLVEVDGVRFYELSYRRRTGVDGVFESYGSVDEENWYPAAMAVYEIVDDGDGFEIVTLRSSFPLPDHDMFLRLEGTLNVENAAAGLIPQKAISYLSGGPMNNMDDYLRENIFQLNDEEEPPYRVVPGRVLYFNVRGDRNGNSTYGGTAENGVDRDFVYRNWSQLKGAVAHAGLLGYQETGIVKVTFIEPQLNFIGSTQQMVDSNTITSQSVTRDSVPSNEPYSYRVDAYDPDAPLVEGFISEAFNIVQPVLSSDATLDGLDISSGELSPAFEERTVNYAARTLRSVSGMTVKPQASALTKLSVNGVPLASGATSDSIPLELGENAIDVLVVSEDGKHANLYSIVVTRSSAVDPAGIAITNIELLDGVAPKLRLTWASEPGATYTFEQLNEERSWEPVGADQPSGGDSTSAEVILSPGSDANLLRIKQN